jgi:hypothetical protein
MKTFIVMICLFMVGCVTVPPRDALYGIPPEVRQAMGEHRLDITGNRNGQAYRSGSPERGFLNINSNRGYTSTEYSGRDGKMWSIRTSNGRVTSWSASGF